MGEFKFKNKLDITEEEQLQEVESYLTTLRAVELLEGKDFELNPQYFRYIHFYLFQDLYDWAGKYRTVDIKKREKALNNILCTYGSHENIRSKIEEVFNEINNTNINELNEKERLEHAIDIMLRLWDCYPFLDGNTRIVNVFITKYCQALGFTYNDNLLLNNIGYVRNALIAASFEDQELGIKGNKSYLYKIMNDMFKNKEEKSKGREKVKERIS